MTTQQNLSLKFTGSSFKESIQQGTKKYALPLKIA